MGETIVERLKAAFPDVRLKLDDARGTGDYWELEIATDAFEGMSRVKKHQAVYKPLRDLMDSNQIHALKIKTFSPAQWAEREGES
ncbi:MAG: BolA/IbaG family iron-sulfur metabolism protein [Acidobacteriota bacterium]|nr:BolA/IbaG family iron-sulfur metabolism protein [Acidobacteriota bacterium]